MLGKNVKFIREKYGYKQSDLAKKLGYGTGAAISLWEKNKAVPPANVLDKLATMIDVSVDDLLHKDVEKLLFASMFTVRFTQVFQMKQYTKATTNVHFSICIGLGSTFIRTFAIKKDPSFEGSYIVNRYGTGHIGELAGALRKC